MEYPRHTKKEKWFPVSPLVLGGAGGLQEEKKDRETKQEKKMNACSFQTGVVNINAKGILVDAQNRSEKVKKN